MYCNLQVVTVNRVKAFDYFKGYTGRGSRASINIHLEERQRKGGEEWGGSAGEGC